MNAGRTRGGQTHRCGAPHGLEPRVRLGSGISAHADSAIFAISAGIFLAGAPIAGLMLRSGRIAVTAEQVSSATSECDELRV